MWFWKNAPVVYSCNLLTCDYPDRIFLCFDFFDHNCVFKSSRLSVRQCSLRGKTSSIPIGGEHFTDKRRKPFGCNASQEQRGVF